MLNVANYRREASIVDGTTPDQRMADGSWLQGARYPGRVWFHVDVPAGERSKWLTLYATRVLDWWDA